MKRKLLSALLAFCMVLTILPGTAMAANYWQNLSRSEAAQVANSMLNRTAKEDLVLIYTHSSASTAAYANYAEENQIKVSCYSGSESFNEMFSLLKDYEWGTSVSFPMIAAYNGVTRSYETITGQGNMAAFEALLDKVGIPSDSGAASSQPLYSSNAGAQNYLGYAGQWAQPVKSHLYENAVGGVTRVEYYGDTVIVEDYDSSYRFLSRKEIPLELPIWGGFFAGENANFLIFGKENPSQSDSAEVIRVVKYSKDWQRQGSYSLNGANTTVPFDAGSVRCTELNGDLYVRTCHEMYTSKDGKNHQSNMTVVVRESDMSLKEAHYAVISGRPDNYTSHSFNQFILTDNSGKVVMVDHGDAYSRAIVIAQYGGGSSNILDIPGATGANATGASVGGLAETSSGYVTAYTYDGVGTGTNSSPRNIYLAYTSKDGLKNSTPVSVTTTKARYSNPVLAPTGLNGGYLLWNDANGTLCYTTYSVDGSVGNTQTASGLLSDCQPISHDGKMVWYTTNNSAPVFYTLDSSGVKAINPATAEKATPVVQANDITVTVGETLPEITGTATFNGSSVPGTWNFVGEAPSTAEAKVFENVNVKFVPNDKDTYNEAKTTINVTINAAPVEKVTPVVEANDITATLGDTLTITGTAKDGEKDVSGTWSFVDAAPNTAGTHENVKVKFTPDNTTAYNEVETSITVTINAAPVEKVTPIVSANDITVTLGNALTITGTAKDGDKTVSGTWSFVDAAPNTVGTHENVKVRFTPTNTAAYNVAETTITVTINAAPVDPTTPIVTVDDISVPYGVTVKDSDIRGTSNVPGVWSFVGTVPTAVGSHRVTVRFTPNDTAAYKSVDRVITLRIYAVDHGDITDWVNFPHNDVIGRPVSNLVAEVVDWIFNQYGVRFAAADFNVYVNEYSVNLASIVRNDTRYVLHFNGNAADNAEFERLFNSRRTLTFGVERESGEEYYIALDKMENGQVIANTRYAESGARVTLSVHPDSGYELDTLEVTDVRGRTVTLRDLEDGRYSFTMPSNRVTVEATFKAVKEERPSLPGPDHTAQNPHDEIFTGLGTPGISGIVLNPAAMPFTDVHGPDWFYNHVEYMWKHYLMSGTTENRFDPNLTTSRAMIWTIMARMNNVRTDINPGSTWYEKGMLWAMERGITDGSNAMGDITREQLATMLWRNAGSPIAGGDLSRFSDADSVSAYALNAVRWAASNGILSGINGRIEPQGTATRAQVAAMVARYGDKVVR